MALSKTVTYTPFQETSFGYGTTEIATAHSSDFPNATSEVLVVIENIAGNWNESEGHISTPKVGTAVSTFHSLQKRWECKGERDDVDAVLAQLKFFPADYASARTWDPTDNALKTNVTTGAYGSTEEPPQIPNTTMTLKVYNGSSTVSSNPVTFDADGPTYGNQRPFWTVEPAGEDLNTTAHGTAAGGLVDLGTISHGTDTENVRVKCAFRTYGGSTNYTGSAYGYFTDDDSIFIGDKKPGTRNTDDARFDFTGSVAETQAFLDNVRYTEGSTLSTFDMYLTISDGVVGSELTKTCWFSSAPFTTSHAIPDLVGTEEQYLSNILPDPNFNITHAPEVNRYWYTITLDSIGAGGVDHMSEGTLSNGVFTSDYSTTFASLRATMQTMLFQFRDDFNDNFTFVIQFHGDNTTVGSTYSSAPETVNVTMTGANEIQDLFSSHTWLEDTTYNLNTGTVVQIAHGYNRNFECRLEINDTNAGVLSATASGSGTATWSSPDLLLVGTRDEVNAMLQTVKFVPVVDYASNFSLSYYQKRVSGDTTSDAAEGDYYNIEIGAANCITMTATPHDEFSITQPSAIDWEENQSKIFNSGLQITDLSSDNSDLPTYNTDYRLEIAMWIGQSEFTNGTIVANTTTGLTQSGVGNQNGQGDTNMISYTGSKTNINAALADLRFIPNLDYFGSGPEVYYKIVRVQDSFVLTNQAQTTKTTFGTATNDPGFLQQQPTINWNWNTTVEFNSGLSITDNATDNDDYAHHDTNFTATIRAKYSDGGGTAQPLTTATFTSTSYGSATVSGSGTVSDPLIITGLKADVNTALANLQMRPDLDWSDSPATNGSFWIESQLERLHDSVVSLNFSPATAFFNAGTQTAGYDTTWGDLGYIEDSVPSTVFSGVTAVTEEVDEYISNVTYEVSFTLGSGISIGVLAPTYADSDYVTPNDFETGVGSEDPDDNYVNDYQVAYTGTRSQVNSLIQNTTFEPYRDRNISSNIQYTQKRYVNGVLSKTEGGTVGNLVASDAPEFTYGTANGNVQYYVWANAVNGFDTSGSPTASDFQDGTQDALLTPKQLNQNLGLTYDRPITVTDAFEDGGASQYKVIITGSFTTSWNINGVSTNDTGWLSKADLHTALDAGFTPTGATTGAVNSTQSASFTLYRRTYVGDVTTIATGSLTFQLKHKGFAGYKNGVDLFPNNGNVFLLAQHSATAPNSSTDDYFMFKNSDGTQNYDTLRVYIQDVGSIYTPPGGGAQVFVTNGGWYTRTPDGTDYGGTIDYHKRQGNAAVMLQGHFHPSWAGSIDSDTLVPFVDNSGGTYPAWGDPNNTEGLVLSFLVYNDLGVKKQIGSQSLSTGTRIFIWNN